MCGCEVRGERREVVAERGAFAGDRVRGNERFLFDGDEEATEGRVGLEVLECFDELVGGCLPMLITDA